MNTDNFTFTISTKKKKKSYKVNITRVSYIAGYSKSHISRVFRGKTRPSVECLAKLAAVVGIRMGELHEAIEGGKIHVKTC